MSIYALDPIDDTPGSLAPIYDLGYYRSVRDEVSVAPQWAEPLAGFIQSQRAKKRSDDTIKLRSYQIRHLSRKFLARSPWSVTGRELEHALNAETGWSLTTSRSAVAGWRAFYKWAMTAKADGVGNGKRYPLAENPTDVFEGMKSPMGRPRPADPMVVDQAIALADDRVRLMIYLGAEAGLRRAEIGKVHRRDMYRDSLGWMLHINGKGDKDRDVPLSQRLSSMLLAYDDGYIFPSQRGSHIGPDRVGKLISKVLGKGTTPHQLRHRFGSDMYIASGYDIRATQEALGHSSVATTQIYTEVPRRKLRAGIDALSAMQDARRIEDNNRRG